MKTLRFLLLLLLTLSLACTKNSDNPFPPTPPGPVDPADSTHTVINDPKTIYEWEYKYLSEWYLWPQDILALSTYNTSLAWDSFFYSMLSQKRLDGYKDRNGKHLFFSTLERKLSTGGRASTIESGDPRPGFDFTIVDAGAANHPFVVLYADPTSDAAAKGIQRGTMIGKINGETITQANYMQMVAKLYSTSTILQSDPVLYGTLEKDSELTFTLCRIENNRLVMGSDVTIRPETTDEDPILLAKVLTVGGKKVGYLHYLQFKTGYPEFDNTTYNDELKAVMRDFQSAGVSEVVLDLRYNGGGAVVSSQLLSSMLVTAGKIGQVFVENRYNPAITAKYFPQSGGSKSYFFSVPQMSSGDHVGTGAGANLNLSRLYVIATGSSASSSELLINSLRGVDMPVYHIGKTTVGKTVGMNVLRAGGAITNTEWVEGGVYTDPKDGQLYTYTMSPVSFSSVNAKGTADYADGFKPNYEIDEWSYFSQNATWKQLGDPEESMLAVALYHIQNGTFPAPQTASRSVGPALRQVEVSSLKPDRGALILFSQSDATPR